MPRQQGFTLVEVLVVAIIIGILLRIAIPSYQQYVQRGNVTEATQNLAQFRVQMEQYYQDNASYAANGNGNGVAQNAGACGVGNPGPLINFTFACATNNNGQGYTATMTGSTASMTGFTYTINQSNVQATTSLPASWGALPATAATSWIIK